MKAKLFLNIIGYLNSIRKSAPHYLLRNASSLRLFILLIAMVLTLPAEAGPLSGLSHRGRTGAKSEKEIGHRDTVERSVIYLGTPEFNYDDKPVVLSGEESKAIRDHVLSHLSVPPRGLDVISVYDNELQHSLEGSWKRPALERLCGEKWSHDFFRSQLHQYAEEVSSGRGIEELTLKLSELIEHFHCLQNVDLGQGAWGVVPLTPIQTEEYRALLALQGVNAWFLQDFDAATRHFQASFALGQRGSLSGLDEPFSPHEEAGLWYDYSLDIRRWLEQVQRVPVLVDVSRVPSRTLYLDGERLPLEVFAGQPIFLYPGTHFLQVVDRQGRIRSGRFQIVDDVGGLKVQLNGRDERLAEGGRIILPVGVESFLAPQLQQADELLMYLLRSPFHIAPAWLLRGLKNYLDEKRLLALYVAAPEAGPSSDPGGQLLVAQVDATGGLRELEEAEQGTAFISLERVAQEDFTERLEPRPLHLSLGALNLGGTGFSTFSGHLELASTSRLSLSGHLDLIHTGFEGGSRRSLGAVGLNIGKEAASQELSWIYGLGFSLWLPGFSPATNEAPNAKPKLLVLPSPEFHIGLEVPARRIGLMSGTTWAKKVTLRVSVDGAVIKGLDAMSSSLSPTELVLGMKIGVRWWSSVLPF